MPNHKYKSQRGWIIRTLYKIFPRKIHCDVLLASMKEDLGFEDLDEHTLKGHLEYLSGHQKEYIVFKECGDICSVKLTPRGVNLFEGDIKHDPGVSLKV